MSKIQHLNVTTPKCMHPVDCRNAGMSASIVGHGNSHSLALAQADLDTAVGSASETTIQAADHVFMRRDLEV